MMKYSDNMDHIVIHCVKNPMSAMYEASIGFAIFRRRCACQRIAGQEVERFVETQKIFVCHIRAKLFDTIKANCNKIIACCLAWYNSMHGRQDIR
jgi:hypothetical protein